MMERINTTDSGQYFYLCDSNGQIIYHPHQVQLDNGMKKESSKRLPEQKKVCMKNESMESTGDCRRYDRLYRLETGLRHAILYFFQQNA